VSFWENNSKILKQHYPGLLEELSSGGDELSSEDIKIETAPAGEPSLCIKGIFVHSQRDPVREGQRLAESVRAESEKNGNGENGAVVVLGFGLGYAAVEAASLQRPVIIVEKYKSLVLKALELRDFTEFLSKNRIIFAVGGSGDGITAALSIADELAHGDVSVLRNRALIELDKEWYGAVENRLRTWKMKDDVNMATLKRFGRRWVRNLSLNMSAIRDVPGISRLEGIAGSSLPVFLAAAGPSLDKISDLLGEIYKRCIIVAVDTNLRFFLRNGVEPDFVVVVDPQFLNSRHLDRCVCEKTALVAESAVYPSVMHRPFGKKFLCGSLFPLGAFIETRVDPKGKLGAGGSVATTAWDFARCLGGVSSQKQEIWIAGLDLAFPGNKTHFHGARFEEKAASEAYRFNPVETWVMRALRDGSPFKAASGNGEQVLTDRRLSLYAAWFENQFRNYAQIRNCGLSQDGLAIAGLHAAKVQDILALPECREEIDRRLDAAFAKTENDFNGEEEKRKRNEKYDTVVSVLKRGLKNIKEAAEEGDTIVKSALRKNLDEMQQGRIVKQLDEILKRIAESEVKEVAGFLFPPAENENTVNETEKDPFRVYLKSSANLFSSLAQAAEFNLVNLR
jgi:hypothetical protein